MSAQNTSPHVAPPWMRWIGIPAAAVCAVAIGLAGHGANRAAGLVVCVAATALWSVAVVAGAIRIRRRDQDATSIVGLQIAAYVIAFGVISFVPQLHHQGFDVRFPELMAAEAGSVALMCLARHAYRQTRRSR